MYDDDFGASMHLKQVSRDNSKNSAFFNEGEGIKAIITYVFLILLDSKNANLTSATFITYQPT